MKEKDTEKISERVQSSDSQGEKPVKKLKKDNRPGSPLLPPGPGPSKAKLSPQKALEKTKSKTSDFASPVSRGFVSKTSSHSVAKHTNETKSKSKKKRNKNKQTGKTSKNIMSDERIKAYGFNPKKFKYTHKAKLKQKDS